MVQEDREKWWDERYARADGDSEIADDWVTRYLPPPAGMLRVLELGAGFGHLSGLLASRGHHVVATDIAPAAVAYMRDQFPGITALQLDHSRPLPFPDGAFDAVIADLSLHYFDATTTEAILAEVARVLTPDGLLLARVNSQEDIDHGAGEGTRIEPGLYENSGHYKRFFDEEMIHHFWRRWRDLTVKRNQTDRYGPPKALYEICARRP